MASETKFTKDDIVKVLAMITIHGIVPIRQIIATWKDDTEYTVKDLEAHTFKFEKPEEYFE